MANAPSETEALAKWCEVVQDHNGGCACVRGKSELVDGKNDADRPGSSLTPKDVGGPSSAFLPRESLCEAFASRSTFA
jgi:hypothetical protein